MAALEILVGQARQPEAGAKLITAEEAAELLCCSAKTVKRMAMQGKIPAMQIGNRWRFRSSLLDEWMRDQLLSGRHPCPPRVLSARVVIGS